MNNHEMGFWKRNWKIFLRHRLGVFALAIVFLFCFVGIYAPFFASSKPIIVIYDGTWYFPLFRYLFYTGLYTKRIDIFFNLLMFTLPVGLIGTYFFRSRTFILLMILIQIGLFLFFSFKFPVDPSIDLSLARQRRETLEKVSHPSWDTIQGYLAPYEKLNRILREKHRWDQHQQIMEYARESGIEDLSLLPTLWQMARNHENQSIERYRTLQTETANADLQHILDRRQWLEEERKKVTFELMPLLRDFHWEDDAGGSQMMNQFLPWWELTRINRKDLVAALIFGIRISLVVGILSVSLAMLIGIPIGCLAGYYGGKFDIIVSRLLEIWESMPTFFMLLLVIGILQSKSIFIVITVIGFFGWTGFSRYVRGEFFKQRQWPYVEACHAQGFRDSYIIFSHILPNAIPPVLTLLPFAIMAAITSEAGLSFLGLGEEGSTSWGVLMDEGRTAFPGESYLLWPPAILLTVLLVAIALVGDAMRDTLDPKMRL